MQIELPLDLNLILNFSNGYGGGVALGFVGRNLTPFSCHGDQQAWKALRIRVSVPLHFHQLFPSSLFFLSLSPPLHCHSALLARSTLSFSVPCVTVSFRCHFYMPFPPTGCRDSSWICHPNGRLCSPPHRTFSSSYNGTYTLISPSHASRDWASILNAPGKKKHHNT